jgi:hypothetical protein
MLKLKVSHRLGGCEELNKTNLKLARPEKSDDQTQRAMTKFSVNLSIEK